MKFRKFSVVVLLMLACVMGAAGCPRALQDGISVGITDGLSDGIAGLISGFLASFADGGG